MTQQYVAFPLLLLIKLGCKKKQHKMLVISSDTLLQMILSNYQNTFNLFLFWVIVFFLSLLLFFLFFIRISFIKLPLMFGDLKS